VELSSAQTVAKILADAAVTPPSHNLKCVEWDIKPYYVHTLGIDEVLISMMRCLSLSVRLLDLWVDILLRLIYSK